MSSSSSRPAELEVGRALARLARHLDRLCNGAGLSLAQYRVLSLVADRPQRAAELANRMEVRRATLSSLVHGLAEAGMLLRKPVAEDGRGVSLELTPAGELALASADEAVGRAMDGLIGRAEVDPQGLRDALTAILAIADADAGCSSCGTDGPGVRAIQEVGR